MFDSTGTQAMVAPVCHYMTQSSGLCRRGECQCTELFIILRASRSPSPMPTPLASIQVGACFVSALDSSPCQNCSRPKAFHCPLEHLMAACLRRAEVPSFATEAAYVLGQRTSQLICRHLSEEVSLHICPSCSGLVPPTIDHVLTFIGAQGSTLLRPSTLGRLTGSRMARTSWTSTARTARQPLCHMTTCWCPWCKGQSRWLPSSSALPPMLLPPAAQMPRYGCSSTVLQYMKYPGRSQQSNAARQ